MASHIVAYHKQDPTEQILVLQDLAAKLSAEPCDLAGNGTRPVWLFGPSPISLDSSESGL